MTATRDTRPAVDPPPPGAPPGRALARTLGIVTLASCAAVIALNQLISHVRTDEYDAWLFAYYGRELLHGAVLYEQVWDNKPPLIFWLNAVGTVLAGDTLVGIRILCALAVTGSAGVLFAITRRLYGSSTAAIATVLGILILTIKHFHVGCNRPATFLVLTELGCIAWYLRSLTVERRRWMALLLAGVCSALSVSLKQSGLAAGIAVGGHLVYLGIAGALPWRTVGMRLGWFVLGVVGAAGAIIAVLACTSDLAWAWHAVVAFNRSYFDADGGSRFVPTFGWIEDYLTAMGLPLILAAATLLCPFLQWLRSGQRDADVEPPGRRPPGWLGLLWAWLGVAVYLALLGPHQRAPYLAVALPPLVLLMAQGIHLLLRSGRRAGGPQPTFAVVVGVVWFAFMLTWPVRLQVAEALRQYHWWERGPDAQLLAEVELIRAQAAPRDGMFVFGYRPELYYRADRAAGIKYIGTEKADQLGAAGRPLMERMVNDLITARPRVILVQPRYLRQATAAGAYDLAPFAAWLTEEYDRPAASGKATNEHIWIRQE